MNGLDDVIDVFGQKSKVGETRLMLLQKLEKAIFAEPFTYFHYQMYGENDFGWGCAYRCCQMILSSLKRRVDSMKKLKIPKILEIQQILVSLNNIPKKDIGSKRWIEPHNVGVILRKHFGLKTKELVYYMNTTSLGNNKDPLTNKKVVPFEKLRLKNKSEGFEIILSDDVKAKDFQNIIWKHFETHETPMMIDDSIQAFIVGGVRKYRNRITSSETIEVLIFDPHEHLPFDIDYYKELENDKIQKGGVYWIDFSKMFLTRRHKSYGRWMCLFPQSPRKKKVEMDKITQE